MRCGYHSAWSVAKELLVHGGRFHEKHDGETRNCFTSNLTVKRLRLWSIAMEAQSYFDDFPWRRGRLLVGEGHFGGDGRQPEKCQMHTKHGNLFRW
jgi:hypothetical protein